MICFRKRYPLPSRSAVFLLLGLSPFAWGSREDSAPLRYAPQSGETLVDVAERFRIQPSEIERLNPEADESITGLLLLRGPKNREEAIEILQEARYAESQGGRSRDRAAALFHEILRSASLVESATGSVSLREPIEIPSDVVAQALLGWGRIHEGSEPEQSRWAYEQVETFFPDLDEFTDTARNRLAALDNPDASSFAEPPPSALRWFPESPHLSIDLDARRFASELPDVSLYRGLRRLEGSEEPELANLIEAIRKRDERIERVLGQIDSLHFGAWIDPELFGKNPEHAMNRMTKMAVGHLRVSPDEFARNLRLGDPAAHVETYDVWKLDEDTYLALGGEWGFLGGEATLRAAVKGAESRSYPRLEAPDSAYQRMRREVGSGYSMFAFVDLEGFLEGPALAYARNVPIEDKEGFVLSLVVSGLLGFNSIQGLAAGLDFEGGTLSADLALAHGGRGILGSIHPQLCDPVVPSFIPKDLEGLLVLQSGCRTLLDPLSGLLKADWLGKAQPAYSAQYRTAVSELSRQIGTPIDPLDLLGKGLGREIGLGFRLVDGPLPFPNWIVALPLGYDGSILPALEATLRDKMEISFAEAEVEGQVYRHGTIPGIPLYIDLAFTELEETLLVATHSTLLEDAVRARRDGETLDNHAQYRDLRISAPTPNVAQLYLSSSFTRKLAEYGSSGLGQAAIHESHPALRKIVKSTLARIASDPKSSGLGVLLAEDRLQVSLRVADFRSWLITALCVAGGREPRDERSDSSQSAPTDHGEPGVDQSDVSRAEEP